MKLFWCSGIVHTRVEGVQFLWLGAWLVECNYEVTECMSAVLYLERPAGWGELLVSILLQYDMMSRWNYSSFATISLFLYRTSIAGLSCEVPCALRESRIRHLVRTNTVWQLDSSQLTGNNTIGFEWWADAQCHSHTLNDVTTRSALSPTEPCVPLLWSPRLVAVAQPFPCKNLMLSLKLSGLV